MRRRLAWRLTALFALLAIPSPALSGTETEGSPRTHVAGIGLSADPGGPRSSGIPRLVRPGSDLRRAGDPQAAAPAPGGLLAPTVLPPTFDGVPDIDVVSPGDPTGALGVTHHLAAVNVHMAFYDRAGIELDPPRALEDLDAALPAGADTFDPKVFYDQYRQRFVLAFASASATQSFLTLVVIPEGSEATTNDWCVTHMSGDQVGGNGKQLADYPMLGFTENRVTLTTNQFNFSTLTFQYVQVVSFRKLHLYDCSVAVVPIKVFGPNKTKDPDGSQAFTISPAISVGGAPLAQYLTSIDFNGSTGKLILWQLRAVKGVLKLTRAHIGGGPMAYPRWGRQCPADSPGTLNDNWDTGDLRITSTFWDADVGRVYTTTAIHGNLGGSGPESLVRWWEIDPATPFTNSRVTRRGLVGAAGFDAAWPSVATDGDGRLWVNYARGGTSQCLAAYAARVQPGATGQASVLIQPGDGRYEYAPGVERWGDYTAISRDPVDPSVMAAYGAYPIDDGVGPPGSATDLWQQVIATLTDV